MEIDLEQLWDSSREEASEEGRSDDMFYIRDRVAEKLGGEIKESYIKKYKPLFD
jgi:hypothetical protein